MSNRAILTSMKFEALSGDVCYGYTLSDEYALDYIANQCDDQAFENYLQEQADQENSE